MKWLVCLLLFLWLFSLFACKRIIRTVGGIPPFGGDGRLATNAFLNYPNGLFPSSNNEIYFTDFGNHIIRKIDKYGIISTIAGQPGLSGDSPMGTLAQDAKLNFPKGIIISQENEIYFTNLLSTGYAIQKISTNGSIFTIAGGVSSTTGNLAIQTQLTNPEGLFLHNNELYFCNVGVDIIQKIFLQNGSLVTIAGIYDQDGYSGDGGLAINAKLFQPEEIVVASNGEIYISDTYNHVIRKIFNNRTITTIAGIHIAGFSGENGPAKLAKLNQPTKLLLDRRNDIYFADSVNCVVRKIFAQNSTIVTIAGIPTLCETYNGNQFALSTAFGSIEDLTFWNNHLLVIDGTNNLIRRIDFEDGKVYDFAGQYPSIDKAVLSPTAIAVSNNNNEIYFAEGGKYVIKKIDSQRRVKIIAGQSGVAGSSGNNILAVNATLQNIRALALDDTTGDLYLAHAGMVRKVNRFGVIKTVTTLIANPISIAITNNTNEIFVVGGSLIRKVFVNNGSVTTVAGYPTYNSACALGCDCGDGGLAVNGGFSFLQWIQYNPLTRELFAFDKECNSVRKIDKNGILRTVAQHSGVYDSFGMAISQSNQIYFALESTIVQLLPTNALITIGGISGEHSFYGDEQEATLAAFRSIRGITVDSKGSLYISDYENNLIRKIATLCTNYTFQPILQSNNNNSVLSGQWTRQCLSDSNAFDAIYLPKMQWNYKSNGKELNSIVAEWDQWQIQTVTQQFLDIVNVSWNACQPSYQIIQNCTTAFEIGITPTNATTNFLFFPSYLSVDFIHYYRISSLVSQLVIDLTFFNLKTNQTDTSLQLQNIITDTTTISGLQHSTPYQVLIATKVIYNNGNTETAAPVIMNFQTIFGVEPNGTLGNVELSQQQSVFILSWSGIAIQDRGTVPIQRIEVMQLVSISNAKIQQNTTLISIVNYNAETNIPNSFIINAMSPFTNYEFKLRVCSAIGCGMYTESQMATYSPLIDPSPTQQLVEYIITPIVITMACCCFVIIFITILLLLLCIMVICIHKRKKVTVEWNNHSPIMIELMEKCKDFRIEESHLDLTGSLFLGSGASGNVFTAKYFNTPVAVKLIKSTSCNLSDFYNELQFLQKHTQHENIIRFFGVYENTEKQYIGLVMEYCSNGTVANYVTNHTLHFSEKISLLHGIAKGMQYLHFQSIAHRDLKCENVLLDENGIPKIIDFGFSKVIQSSTNIEDSNLTMNVGTAIYCAPEVISWQLKQNPLSVTAEKLDTNSSLQMSETKSSESKSQTTAYDQKCDVYSFAIVTYVVYFQNSHPYGMVSDNQILFHISSNPSFRPKIEESKIPKNESWLIELMKHCWQSDAVNRPSFEQICAVLERSSSYNQ